MRGFTATQRPDRVGDGHLSNPTADRYFDRSAFERPADNIGRFGNAGVGILEGPGKRVFSLTIGKAVTFAGTSRLRLEVALSNLVNLENLDVPNTVVKSSAFARITATQTMDGGTTDNPVFSALLLLTSPNASVYRPLESPPALCIAPHGLNTSSEELECSE